MTTLTLFGLALSPLYAAIAKIESDNGQTSPNVYQIDEDGHGYTDDVNRILKIRSKALKCEGLRLFSPKDALNIPDAEYMMAVYWSYYGDVYKKETGLPVTYEVLARIHNGGPFGWKKPATLAYWAKVKAVMEGGAK